jgi:hypothetical protein
MCWRQFVFATLKLWKFALHAIFFRQKEGFFPVYQGHKFSIDLKNTANLPPAFAFFSVVGGGGVNSKDSRVEPIPCFVQIVSFLSPAPQVRNCFELCDSLCVA